MKENRDQDAGRSSKGERQGSWRRASAPRPEDVEHARDSSTAGSDDRQQTTDASHEHARRGGRADSNGDVGEGGHDGRTRGGDGVSEGVDRDVAHDASSADGRYGPDSLDENSQIADRVGQGHEQTTRFPSEMPQSQAPTLLADARISAEERRGKEAGGVMAEDDERERQEGQEATSKNTTCLDFGEERRGVQSEEHNQKSRGARASRGAEPDAGEIREEENDNNLA
jgi:hypothetical protein